MKIKTKDLIGIQLDWLVAVCEGKDSCNYYGAPEVREGELYLHYCGVLLNYPYSPSSDWGTGGPILQREKLHVTWSPLWEQWVALIPTNSALGITGPTLLVAAMRAYTTSKLGDEVEVPDELSAI